MIDPGQEMIFPAGTRHGGSQLSISHGTDQGRDPSQEPEEQQRKPGPQLKHLEPETGKYTCPDHIGDHDGNGSI